MNSPRTAADFAALVADFAALVAAARAEGEEPAAGLAAFHIERKGAKVRICGINTTTGKAKRVSTWQDSEEHAVYDAIARAFC